MADVTYREVLVADRWTIRVPEERLAVAWATWEYCRFHSMAANLSHGDLLFDVGTEWADISAVYAQFVGPENMVLIEPHPETWTIIKRSWEEHGFARPAGCWAGLVGATTWGEPVPSRDGWPEPAFGEMWRDRSYRHIHLHSHETPCRRLRDLERPQGRRVVAFTIDVEGAELDVLQGIDFDQRPLVWCSVHPDMLERDYGHPREDLFNFMRDDAGYCSRLLGVDHEEHWLFWPKERGAPK